MIIFCKDCKHYSSLRTEKGERDSCNHKSNIETIITYNHYSYGHKRAPMSINQDNNCKHFEPSRWYTFKKFFNKAA